MTVIGQKDYKYITTKGKWDKGEGQQAQKRKEKGKGEQLIIGKGGIGWDLNR